jgi:hypothetical protein
VYLMPMSLYQGATRLVPTPLREAFYQGTTLHTAENSFTFGFVLRHDPIARNSFARGFVSGHDFSRADKSRAKAGL